METIEAEVPAEPQEAEYVKPNPQDNPRNIALAEIAKTVAEQHKAEVVEDNAYPSIDDDGVITPAKAQPAEAAPTAEVPAAETPAAETPEPAAAPAATPAAAVPVAEPEQETIDPKKLYKVKVDGVDVEVPGQKIIDAGFRTFQKETAADYRLKQASDLLRQTEERLKTAPTQPQQPPQPAQPQGPTDQEIAQAIQFGTPEQASQAVAILKSRGTLDPVQIRNFVVEQTRSAARDEMQFQEALNFVKSEYGDLFENDYLKRLFFTEENRRRAPKERGGEGDTRPYKDLYQAIGDDLRKSLNLPKPQARSATPAPSAPAMPATAATQGTAQARAQAKARTPSVPRSAASRLAATEAASKVKTPSEIIAEMAARRGKDRLTPQPKGQ